MLVKAGFLRQAHSGIFHMLPLGVKVQDKLERRTGLPVHTWDERLTTVAADKLMMEAGVRRENRKEYVDMIAAVLILQEYLDRQRMQAENGQEN